MAKVFLVILGTVAMAACRQDMHDQPRYKPLEFSELFEDGRSSRHLVPGTIPAGVAGDTPLLIGMNEGRFVDSLPVPLDRDLVLRGQQRFNIYCSPCHGLLGDGDGMVSRRGYLAPPSLHSARSRALPAGYVFLVISNGFGAMPDYSNQVAVRDRWAIVAYIQALQIARSAEAGDVPPPERKRLEEENR